MKDSYSYYTVLVKIHSSIILLGHVFSCQDLEMKAPKKSVNVNQLCLQ